MIFFINASNRNDYVMFDEENEINFFKKADWILDYQEMKKLTEFETKTLIADIS